MPKKTKIMKKVMVFHIMGDMMTADMDDFGNLTNIEDKSPVGEWKSLPTAKANKPKNGVSLRSIDADFDHTTAYILSGNTVGIENPLHSEVVVSPIFPNHPSPFQKGSDMTNDTIFGEYGW